MKKALSLILALVMCLSLCACGGRKAPNPTRDDLNNETTQDTNGEQNETLDNNTTDGSDNVSSIIYDYTSPHPLLNTVYGEWVLDGSISWMVMPLKILFREDGTCFVEFPDYAIEQTKEMLWGIVPDCLNVSEKLFVRIGVEDDICYIFQISPSWNAIATHMALEEGGRAIDGLSEDGLDGMWFDMQKADIDNEDS